MQYERSVTLTVPYADAVATVKELLTEQGFGVLSEIDVRATILDPQTMSGVTGLDALQPVADEASQRLQAVLDGLVQI